MKNISMYFKDKLLPSILTVLLTLISGLVGYYIKGELEKSSIKHVEVWKSQKDLMLEFVDFMERDFFNNPRIWEKSNPDGYKEERETVLRKFNWYYGKLYLILDTDVIENINKVFHNTVSDVQRYYLYKEMPRQLLKSLYSRETIGEEEFPFISKEVNRAGYYKDKQEAAKSFDELKERYPFVEKGKGLPAFTESQ
jgi:hypothetical protein